MKPALKILVPIIFILTTLAALGGIWPGTGETQSIKSIRGEAITLNARGLYWWDTVSMAAQMQANDLVTLCLALPLLAWSYALALRGSFRGLTVMTGITGFLLYTYTSMVFGAQYNAFFLLYTPLFSLSLWAFVLCLMSFDLPSMPARFSDRLPRRWIAGFMFAAAGLLVLAWLGRLAPDLGTWPWAADSRGGIQGVPALENSTSPFIQAMDLGLVVPLCLVAGILLLRKRPWGYLLAATSLVKFMTLGISVSLMGVNMALAGAGENPVLVMIFAILAALAAASTIIMLVHVKPEA